MQKRLTNLSASTSTLGIRLSRDTSCRSAPQQFSFFTLDKSEILVRAITISSVNFIIAMNGAQFS